MVSSQDLNTTKPAPELFYTALSPSPQSDGEAPSHRPPIIFLHGLELSHKEFSQVTPFLCADYPLILVDLPGHSGSAAVPFSMANAVAALSHLITTKIPGGKAHVVGMSLGGVVGLELAKRCPQLVLSLFCTGCAPPSGFRRWAMARPRLSGGLEMALGVFVTESIFWYSLGVKAVPGLRDEFRKNQSLALVKAGYTACAATTVDGLADIEGVRVAIVAGEKRDAVEQTRESGRMLRSKVPESKAFVVRNAVHLWDLQFPELFANGVRAWIEGEAMPKEFELLE